MEESQKKWDVGNAHGLFDIVFARDILHSDYRGKPDLANKLLDIEVLRMEEVVRSIVQT